MSIIFSEKDKTKDNSVLSIAKQTKERKKYSIFLISNQSEKYLEIQRSLAPELIYYFDGSEAESFSQLVNNCIASCPTETIIIASSRVEPTASDVNKILDILDRGYGLVGLYRFAFFGFKKELIRKIGFFDQRFIKGWWEDVDFVMRMVIANIAFFFTEEVKYIPGPSSWDHDEAEKHFQNKWQRYYVSTDGNNLEMFEKTLSEELYDYELGPPVPVEFLSVRDHSYVDCPVGNSIIVPFLLGRVVSSVPFDYVNNKF